MSLGWRARLLAGQTGVAGTDDGAGTAAKFNQPTGITVDPADSQVLYVAEGRGNRIRRLDMGSGPMVSTIGTAIAPTNWGLARAVRGASSGKFYCSANYLDSAGDQNAVAGRFLSFNPSGGGVTNLGDYYLIYDVWLDPAESYAFVTYVDHHGGLNNARVAKVRLSDGVILDDSGFLPNFTDICSLLVPSDGYVYVYVTGNGFAAHGIWRCDAANLSSKSQFTTGTAIGGVFPVDGTVAAAMDVNYVHLLTGDAAFVGGQVHSWPVSQGPGDPTGWDDLLAVPSFSYGAGLAPWALVDGLVASDTAISLDGYYFGWCADGTHTLWLLSPGGGWRTGSIGMS